ncbi:cupin domain-containing protein [Conexibacter sp. JD483]|uniref:cupin domain-containing protein n=1 Tax=unclassified Conexibacter TaxID=2627773 RepID=UPI0027279F95|nr:MULTISPECIES: cupin domain-containing protein [unclassified Conexibacter]MDO8188356.1 cupin domain-containing protein [Conexibacter sp. CPCC 205706]MDO8201102.1 cupin domain-containing protein [Conexibacter sp. CPCC 205762]MDR9372156.1 cupin domain-containing protein [Conexibacter sp. JD483]
MADTETSRDGATSELGTRLRGERERQSIGVRELSRRLGVSASMISQIERGRVMPSVNTLYSITSALGISLDDLFGEAPGGVRSLAAVAGAGAAGEASAEPAAELPSAPLAPPASPVQRGEDCQRLQLGSGVTWALLTSSPRPDIDFLKTTYAVGSESTPADALMRHAGHEYGTVLDGRLGVTVGFDTYELEPGDSISFESSTPHRLYNAGDEPAVAIWVVVGRGGDPRAD